MKHWDSPNDNSHKDHMAGYQLHCIHEKSLPMTLSFDFAALSILHNMVGWTKIGDIWKIQSYKSDIKKIVICLSNWKRIQNF